MAARDFPPAHIGCSGFSYDHWRGVFYPEGLARDKWLGYYATRFHTVELNVTFYRLPPESTFRGWYEKTPGRFLISVKGSRFITHVKRLKDTAGPLARFFENVKPLGEKMAVVLWQFPPGFKSDPVRFQSFLRELGRYKSRCAFEFRNETWVREKDVISMLSDSGHALCMADWPDFLDELPQTADFVYLRRHGHGTYGGSYSREELRRDAGRIGRYRKAGREVFIYFNNDLGGFAAENALYLQGIAGRALPAEGKVKR
ncbi:MAG: DUF72 domain-containing protein [Nitrospiraceae bacterium]|nr:DUF72 domain-containing protein [Nitrospiraceae bacterium]